MKCEICGKGEKVVTSLAGYKELRSTDGVFLATEHVPYPFEGYKDSDCRGWLRISETKRLNDRETLYVIDCDKCLKHEEIIIKRG